MLSSDWFSFPGLDSNLPRLAMGPDWSVGGEVRLKDFREALSQEFLQNGVLFNKMEWLRLFT